VLAAYEAGCRRFDSALTGLGGCPFASDELVGNIPTESVLAALVKAGVQPRLDRAKLAKVIEWTNEIRTRFARGAVAD
jgi:hydroxymethylglutaryl-CoA lyase